jgi:hypothetical protein
MRKTLLSLIVIFLLFPNQLKSQNNFPHYLKDRGTGIPTSMFGTYVNEGEFIIYPFYEFYYDEDAEYKPAEFGYNVSEDFRALARAHEGLLFFS